MLGAQGSADAIVRSLASGRGAVRPYGSQEVLKPRSPFGIAYGYAGLKGRLQCVESRVQGSCTVFGETSNTRSWF